MTTFRKLPTIAPKAKTNKNPTISGIPVTVSNEDKKILIITSKNYEMNFEKKCGRK
jgi:hypothetical protein